VFLDDLDTTRAQGGKVYSTYRIDPSAGAIIVVRPDGYVGTVAPLSNLADVEEYFSSFLLPA
jgi:phenol 2-monooxygenase